MPRKETPDESVAIAEAEAGSTDEEFCYAHTSTPTRLHCSRCDRPICGRCAIPASVGQHCPECVAEARRTTPRVKSVTRAVAPAVVGIIIANIVVFVAQQASAQVTANYSAISILIHAGEFYRLVTSMFLHHPNTFLHIALNMYVLYSFGPPVEQAFGTVRFLAMYLIAGFGGSAASYAFGACTTRSVGASGAIFGVVGILVAYLYKRRSSMVASAYLRSIGIFVALNLGLGFVLPGIDYLAHIGGLASGIALGWGVERARDGDMPGGQIVALATVLALAVALVVWRTANFPEVCVLPG